MNIQSEHEKQIQIIKWIELNLSCTYENSEENIYLARLCFDLVIEHHASICKLYESNYFGSMFALLRVEYEALVKGFWLNHVASKECISKYKEDDVNIGFGTYIRLVESYLDAKEGALYTIKEKQYKIFSSFTHTGYQALVRRVNDTHIGAVNYKHSDIITVLKYAGIFSLLAAIQLAAMTKNTALIDKAMSMLKNYSSTREDNEF